MEAPSRSGPPPLPRGAAAEAAALRFLEARGFTPVATNWRCRQGEIDLVVRQDRLLVFAEVRLRNRDDFGGALASVTLAKQRKIVATAQAFLQHHPEFCTCDCRFDVLALRAGREAWQVRWLPAAFTT